MTHLNSLPTEAFSTLSSDQSRLLLDARHHQPHGVLGMHPLQGSGLVVRAFIAGAISCEVIDYAASEEKRYPMHCVHEDGLFECLILEKRSVFSYRLRIEKTNGEIHQCHDPYSFLPTLTEEDLYLLGEGNHHHIHHKLGSHVKEINGVPGVSFALWAPRAKRVSVVGDFNHWDGRYHSMRSLGSSGVWELFIPGLEAGMKYKYELIGADDALNIKTDPYAMQFESPPHNASIVCDISDYKWSDTDWIKKRAGTNWKETAISVYEVHMGSWKRSIQDGNRPLTYREMAVELVDYLKDMHYTHVEFMPLAEHPFSGSWGYQVTGFFAPTHRFGTAQDFMYLVDTLHQNDIGVLMDWVPAHFPKDAFALARFDGTHLYEHADPRKGEHEDWGTLIFNYGRHEVANFLKASALSWFERFHIDGMRVDAVASMLYLDYSRKEGEWIPNKYGGRENIDAIHFLRDTNDRVHQYYPGALMIAEESTAWGGVTNETQYGGLGFDLKWNMGWMHDTLEYFSLDPLFRRDHHHKVTFGMLYQNTECFALTFSHDEVVHGKGSMIGKMGAWDISSKAQTLRALYALMWMWPGKNTLFMGCDFGQSAEWKYDASLDWHLLQYMDHQGIQNTVRDLNKLYLENTSLAKHDFNPEGFQWINTHDQDNSVYSFIRLGDAAEETFLFVANLTPVARNKYKVGLPLAGDWEEVFNSNAACYGGSGEGNLGSITSVQSSWNGREYSAEVYLPGLTSMVFRYIPAPLAGN